MPESEDLPPNGTTLSSRSRSSRPSTTSAADRSDNRSDNRVYGYHNTFRTHAAPVHSTPPPTYACATSPATVRHFNEKAQAESADTELPAYACTVEIQGALGLKQELSSPFELANNRTWSDVYVVLRGTQLSIHRLKHPSILSKNRAPGPGKLIKNYTLQHAEIGLAADFRKTGPTPKSPFAHLIPISARQKLFETDPQMFDPIREYAIRLRMETEQFLLCAASQEEMLDWVENLTAALDISPPLDDRSEPRYRSLPRRTRRQRMLDGSRVNLDNLSAVEGGRMLVAEQEQIIRRLYPHLAGTSTNEPAETNPATAAQPATDPETDDLDPDDVRFPSMRRTASNNGESEGRPSSSTTTESSDPKSRHPHVHSRSQALRYRRRCAPILLANSPRVSDVVFCGGKRMRINVKEHILIPLTSLPPRYDVHNFPKKKDMLPRITESTPAKAAPERPAAPVRGVSDDSFMSFGYDLSSTSSQQNISGSESDHITSAPTSEPPSPTLATHVKADASRKLVAMGKTRSNEDRARDDDLNAVALGVGLLI